MAVNIYRISREFVWWQISSPNDLSSATAEVACISDPEQVPEEADWVSATIIAPDDPDFGDGENWWVQLLVGPEGDLQFDTQTDYPADFQTWVRIDDNPERPVRKPGVVTVE